MTPFKHKKTIISLSIATVAALPLSSFAGKGDKVNPQGSVRRGAVSAVDRSIRKGMTLESVLTSVKAGIDQEKNERERAKQIKNELSSLKCGNKKSALAALKEIRELLDHEVKTTVMLFGSGGAFNYSNRQNDPNVRKQVGKIPSFYLAELIYYKENFITSRSDHEPGYSEVKACEKGKKFVEIALRRKHSLDIKKLEKEMLTLYPIHPEPNSRFIEFTLSRVEGYFRAKGAFLPVSANVVPVVAVADAPVKLHSFSDSDTSSSDADDSTSSSANEVSASAVSAAKE